MEIRLLIEPQFGSTFEQELTFVRAAERLGFPAVLRSDHLVNTSPLSGLPGPTEAWTSLAGLARETSTIRLGTLMTSAHFRAPALLALIVAQVDQMSNGRIELGLGAGWFGREHEAFGRPFPSPPERLNRLEEQLAIISTYWATPQGSTFSFDGSFYRVVDCPGLPKPHQNPGPPIIVGGGGPRRTPALAARYATEFNVGLVDPDVVATQFARVRAACDAINRDPDELIYSSATTVCCGTTEAEALARVEQAKETIEDYRTIGVAGTSDQVNERLAEFARAGAARFYLRLLDITDLDQLEILAAEVVPEFP